MAIRIPSAEYVVTCVHTVGRCAGLPTHVRSVRSAQNFTCCRFFLPLPRGPRKFQQSVTYGRSQQLFGTRGIHLCRAVSVLTENGRFPICFFPILVSVVVVLQSTARHPDWTRNAGHWTDKHRNRCELALIVQMP